MEWHDEGLIIGARRHGEASVILEAMTRGHGRHLGLVKGGRSARMQPLLQPGNTVRLVWRARLDEHLGLYAVEAVELRAARLMAEKAPLQGLNLLGSLLRLLAEREPHAALYDAAILIASHLTEIDIGPVLMARFELAILSELGFGLDFSRCAATGDTKDLIYVSPKSGRAVSRDAGEPYRERLLPLPGFLHGETNSTMPTLRELREAFALAAYFLSRDVFGPRGLPMPDAHSAYLAALPARVG
jgi:DNA repair protein RecO (recombination protein O)